MTDLVRLRGGHMMRTLVTVVLAAALGCARGPKDCAERMERLEARLTPLAKEPPSFLVVPPGLDPVESSAGRPVPGEGPVVVVSADGTVSSEDTGPTDLAEIREVLYTVSTLHGARARQGGDEGRCRY